MNDVKDQFVAYKIGVDSLWTNQQTNLAMTSSFPLGTGGQTTQGGNSIIPILQPVASSGTLAIKPEDICTGKPHDILHFVYCYQHKRNAL